MSIRPGTQPSTTEVPVDLDTGDWELHGKVSVPTGPISLGDLLPVARGLSDAIVSGASRAVAEMGACVSCKAGCGACCRMMVDISEVEARRIRQVVQDLPGPRRAEIQARFKSALHRLAAAGLLPALLGREHLNDEEYTALATSYFEQQIACPFLENESCSIYQERPITCREYLVTSPAENCSRPTPKTIQRIHLPLRVFNAVARWQAAPSDHFQERLVSLILALEWAETHVDDPPPRPGPELLQELLNLLSSQIEPDETPDASVSVD
jgi:Fe-S-cluster containining protein